MKNKNAKEDIFECPQRKFHFSWKKWTCTSKRGRRNAIHMRLARIWVNRRKIFQ